MKQIKSKTRYLRSTISAHSFIFATTALMALANNSPRAFAEDAVDTKVKDKVEQIKKDVEKSTDKAKDNAKKESDKAKEKLDKAKDNLKHDAEKLKDKIQEPKTLNSRPEEPLHV